MRKARIEETKEGRLPAGDGWFILNLGEMPWGTVPGFGRGGTLTGERGPVASQASAFTSTSCARTDSR